MILRFQDDHEREVEKYEEGKQDIKIDSGQNLLGGTVSHDFNMRKSQAGGRKEALSLVLSHDRPSLTYRAS